MVVSLLVRLPALSFWPLLILVGFADENALILYVYLSNYDDGDDHSVLTVSSLQFETTLTPLTCSQYYISSFSV